MVDQRAVARRLAGAHAIAGLRAPEGAFVEPIGGRCREPLPAAIRSGSWQAARFDPQRDARCGHVPTPHYCLLRVHAHTHTHTRGAAQACICTRAHTRHTHAAALVACVFVFPPLRLCACMQLVRSLACGWRALVFVYTRCACAPVYTVDLLARL